ncbi:MAG: hypothetical protein AAFS06_18975, partial [Cyanobacteria bacterium J06631_12]
VLLTLLCDYFNLYVFGVIPIWKYFGKMQNENSTEGPFSVPFRSTAADCWQYHLSNTSRLLFQRRNPSW